jgi:hypothetical protein
VPLDFTRHPTILKKIILFSLNGRSFSLYGYIYIYIEKEKVYNIEGQLRGLQGSDYPKTCAPQFSGALCTAIKHLYPREARETPSKL